LSWLKEIKSLAKAMSNFSNILLLGGNGFVGKNFNHLNNKYNVTSPSSKELDLKVYKNVYAYINKMNPDLVINLAGTVGGILANKSDNYRFLDNNIQINQNLIRGLVENKVTNFLNVSSSCIYPKNMSKALKEEMILSGYLEETNEGYALAKIASLKSCNYISSKYGYNYKTIIPCNLFGPFDNFNEDSSHMIPGVISRMFKAKTNNIKKLKIWGDGSVRREFMYIKDFVSFLFFSIENFEKIPLTLNVGLGYDYTIKDYYDLIADSMNTSFNYVNDESKPIGMKRKLVDISKLKSLGWYPSYNIETGIKETINYYESRFAKI